MERQCLLTELNRVLLATDGSDFSDGAVREALGLAQSCSSHLLALTAVETNLGYTTLAPNVAGKLGEVIQDQELQARKDLETVRSEAAEAGIDCDIAVEIGVSAAGMIVDAARRDGSELIVMGRRGLSGISRLAMGSVTAKVIGRAPCDVLVVPRDARPGCFQTILAATDGSGLGETAVTDAIKMARKCDSDLVVFSAAPSGSRTGQAADALRRAESLAAAEGAAIRTATATGRPHEEILKAARLNHADLIVVGRHGRGVLEKLLVGSVTERVIGNASCAVMVVNPQGEK